MTAQSEGYMNFAAFTRNNLSYRFFVTALSLAVCASALSFGAHGILAGQGRRERRYDFTGYVKSVDKANRRATIKHEKVGDLMEPMTMAFVIKDAKALSEMEPGDQIKATLVSREDGAQWLEKVVILVKAKEVSVTPLVLDVNGEPSVIMGASGSRPPPPSRFDNDPDALYTCSMHLDYRARQPGKCPRCAMTLISTEPGIPEEFNLEMHVTPKVPQPGQPLHLRFAVFNPRTGAKVKKFGLLHDRFFHLFLVSQDLNDFQHIHPRQLPDGSFVVNTAVQRTGLYKVYADFYPLEGAPQVLQTHLATAGWNGEVRSGLARLTPDTNLTKMVAGQNIAFAEADKLGVNWRALEPKAAGPLKVQLSFENTPLISGQKSTLKYSLTDAQSGEPVRDLIPYLSAWGHTLILSADQTDVVHSHPEEKVDVEADTAVQRGGPALTFDALFPAPGNYRVWTQFLRGRQVYLVVFDVHVEPIR